MVAPRIDIRDFFQRKLRWRYAKGVPEKRADAEVFLGDARDILKCTSGFVSDFILTSPPYCGVTNYEYDNWIRLWMLGGPSLPSFKHAARFEARSNYRELIQGVFSEAKNISTDHVTAYVRTDARPFTLEVTIRALVDTWPEHSLLCRYDRARGPTQTALFGNLWNKAGEIDLLLVPKGGGPVDGFQLVRAA